MMYSCCVAQEFQLKQARIEPLEEENAVILEVLPVKRGCASEAALVKTTAEWEALADFVPGRGKFVVYSDFAEQADEDGKTLFVPGLKVGDGVTPVNALPFISAGLAGKLLTLSEEEMCLILGDGEPYPDGPSAPSYGRLPEILTEEEMREILGDYPPEKDGPDAPEKPPAPPEVMSEAEMLEILNQDPNGQPVAGADRGDILTEQELLSILNHGQSD